MIYSEILANHKALNTRKNNAAIRLKEIKTELSKVEDLFLDKPISVYCTGSLARGDVGKHSDLDLFVVASDLERKISRLEELKILSGLIDVNSKLGYESFSNDGEFLKIYSETQMITALGAPRDDAENLFTSRMLLLLESHAVCNDMQYEKFLDDIISHYFRDSRGKRQFRPLFILNDILRWWRTVCLNYELVRDDNTKPWRKKNINLKFSRMITVFGTVLPLIAMPVQHAEDLKKLMTMTPLERFSSGLDLLHDSEMIDNFEIFLNSYEQFLVWKEEIGDSSVNASPEIDRESKQVAKIFSDFIFNAIWHSSIDENLKKYLVI